MERGINAPQWGADGWIYFGSGAGGGTITGPNLAQPVELPRSDFRIRADGSAIEPVSGSTGTFGFAMTEAGDRFTRSTGEPSRYFAGRNTTPWQARETGSRPPREWDTVTVDLWKDMGAFTLTGLAPTAMGGDAWFDRIELLRQIVNTRESATSGKAGSLKQ